jgi:hypothetical protein
MSTLGWDVIQTGLIVVIGALWVLARLPNDDE